MSELLKLQKAKRDMFGAESITLADIGHSLDIATAADFIFGVTKSPSNIYEREMLLEYRGHAQGLCYKG